MLLLCWRNPDDCTKERLGSGDVLVKQGVFWGRVRVDCKWRRVGYSVDVFATIEMFFGTIQAEALMLWQLLALGLQV